jgi:hypothetical protein
MVKRTKVNHYVSRALARNFREKETPLWTLNCINGIISNKNTSENNLFMKRNAWSQPLENAFSLIENETMPLIKEILFMPRNTFSTRVFIDRLDNKYNNIQKYIFQSIMFQRANSPKSILPESEMRLSDSLSFNFTPIGNPYIIMYNHLIFNDQPLILPDNTFSFATMPTQDKLGYSSYFFLPISPYSLLLFGNYEQAMLFAHKNISPHSVNLYKALIESKSCKFASSNKKYLSWFANEYKHYSFSKKSIQIKSSR